MLKIQRLRETVKKHLHQRRINLRIRRIASQVSTTSNIDPKIRPVVFFNATTRLAGVSLNAAYSLIASWVLRLQQVPVIHFVCHAGMSRCVLGTDRTDLSKLPPCKACIEQSHILYSDAEVVPFTYHEQTNLPDLLRGPALDRWIDPNLINFLRGLLLDRLMEYEYQPPAEIANSLKISRQTTMPIGQLVLPSIRWALRRHHLQDDESTRFLYCEYILSAIRIAQEFSALLEDKNPQAVVLFNGQFFPEATARWLAIQRGIRTVTHEVGLQPLSAFFTTGEATAYPLDIPGDFKLNDSQNMRLDAYLSQRFQGQFSMAGIRFWPEIQGLDGAFLDKAASFKQIVPVFTNVIFDTSQPHSNVVFPNMFSWLDLVLEIARNHPETLFVLRAHPDEARPGKASQESVSQWVARNQADSLRNLTFVDADQSLSSYELIQRSRFIMVYNSTIGLEASIMGVPVLCAGRARFTQLPTVFFPPTPQEYRQQAELFLDSQEISTPPEFKQNARRFLYYQLFRSSLPFGDFIESSATPGFVSMRDFSLDSLSPKNNATIRIITHGILDGAPFLLESDDEK